jgi:hypothetical protein
MAILNEIINVKRGDICRERGKEGREGRIKNRKKNKK